MFQMIILETLSTTSAVNSDLENFSHRTHDAVGDFYLFIQIIEKSLTRGTLFYQVFQTFGSFGYNPQSRIPNVAPAL